MIGGPRRAIPAVVRVAAVASMLTIGCEYFRDTPEQELANRRWRECTFGLRDVRLDRVDVDGRIRFTYYSGSERDRVLECLAAAGRLDRTLPEAIASLVAGK